MKKLHISRALMIVAILLIVAFQSYWLNRLYKDEQEGFAKETNAIFRDLVYNMQVERFKADTLIYRQKNGNNLFMFNAVNALRKQVAGVKKDARIKNKDTAGIKKDGFFVIRKDSITNKQPNHIQIRRGAMPPEVMEMIKEGSGKMHGVMDTAMLRSASKSGMKVIVQFNDKIGDTISRIQKHTIPLPPSFKRTIKIDRTVGSSTNFDMKIDGIQPEKAFIRMITDGKALDDTIATAQVDSAYKKELVKAGIPVAFSIKKSKEDSLHRKDTIAASQFRTSPAVVGFVNPYWYQAEFESPVGYLLGKMVPQVLFSVFLVAFISISFIFLYRNLLAQRKLTEIKNDFISNVTHELKTPIATVNVAIEALRNFGGLQSPERTKEYLDISASELQRLSLLVDKVLKLSMFENQKITLQKEIFDMQLLVEEVMASMKLQFDKQKVVTELGITGQNFMIDADRLHITSVVYNLLDNALKYSKEEPRITVKLIRHQAYVELQVTDNGIGVAEAYRTKIFEQFFRVPNGNRHNIKGYGLGLSYVNHIVRLHNGDISIESELGKGSTFIVKVPYTAG